MRNVSRRSSGGIEWIDMVMIGNDRLTAEDGEAAESESSISDFEERRREEESRLTSFCFGW